MEEWRDIQGFEGLYQVSNYGRVRAIDRFVNARYGGTQFRRGQIIKGVPMPNGYLCVGLWKNGKSKPQYIHRLVASAFIINPNNYGEVNHKDEDKRNNHSVNLEWCDHLYNLNYGTVAKRISKTHLSLKKGKRIAQYKEGELISVYDSAEEACKQTGIDASAIRKVCLGRPKFRTAGGYIWRDIV